MGIDPESHRRVGVSVAVRHHVNRYALKEQQRRMQVAQVMKPDERQLMLGSWQRLSRVTTPGRCHRAVVCLDELRHQLGQRVREQRTTQLGREHQI